MFGLKLKEANETIESQKEIISQQENRLRKSQERYNELVESLKKIEKQRDEFKAQIRDQTEADLLLVSTKIIEKIKGGTKQGSLELGSLQQEQERLRAAMGRCGSGWGHSGQQSLLGMRLF